MPRKRFLTAQGAGIAQQTPPEPDEQPDMDFEQPAILISPIKARAAKKTVASKTDLEVWSLPDQEIIGEYKCPPEAGLFSIFCLFRCFKIHLVLKNL